MPGTIGEPYHVSFFATALSGANSVLSSGSIGATWSFAILNISAKPMSFSLNRLTDGMPYADANLDFGIFTNKSVELGSPIAMM